MNAFRQKGSKNDNSREVLLLSPNVVDHEIDLDGSGKALNDLGNKAVSDLVVEAPNLTVILDFEKDSAAFLNTSAKISANPVDDFAFQLSGKFGISKDKVLADAELKAAYLQWREFQLNKNRWVGNEKNKSYDLDQSFKLKVAGYAGEKKEEAPGFLKDYIRTVRRRNFAVKVFERLDGEISTPEQKLYATVWTSSHNALTEKYLRKEITAAMYLAESDKLDVDLADTSGDKELQRELVAYKADVGGSTVVSDKVVIAPKLATEKPVEVSSETRVVLSSTDAKSFRLDFHDDGSASALVGPEKYPMQINIFRDEKTNKYFCYISDVRANDGFVRVESENLSEALDDRYLDSYISSKLGLVTDDSDSPNKIPDDKLILSAQKLLGSASDRNFRVDDEKREVLDAIITMLKTSSTKYLNFYKKIEALNHFLEDPANVAKLKRRFENGEVGSIDELL